MNGLFKDFSFLPASYRFPPKFVSLLPSFFVLTCWTIIFAWAMSTFSFVFPIILPTFPQWCFSIQQRFIFLFWVTSIFSRLRILFANRFFVAIISLTHLSTSLCFSPTFAFLNAVVLFVSTCLIWGFSRIMLEEKRIFSIAFSFLYWEPKSLLRFLFPTDISFSNFWILYQSIIGSFLSLTWPTSGCCWYYYTLTQDHCFLAVKYYFLYLTG